jgi:hypothetical protein
VLTGSAPLDCPLERSSVMDNINIALFGVKIKRLYCPAAVLDIFIDPF